MSAGRVILGVIGACFAALAVALLTAGAALLWAYGTQRNPDGFFTTGVAEMSTEAYAITSAELDLGGVPSGFIPSGWLATVQVTADSGADSPIFVGVGPSAETAAYLDDVAIVEVSRIESDGDVRYVTLDGGAPSGPPAEQDFWVESAEGAGSQSLEWDIHEGEWTIVVMNADASPEVDVRMSAGAITNWVPLSMVVLFVGGFVSGILAIGLIVLAVRRPRASAGPGTQSPSGGGAQLPADSGNEPVRQR